MLPLKIQRVTPKQVDRLTGRQKRSYFIIKYTKKILSNKPYSIHTIFVPNVETNLLELIRACWKALETKNNNLL